MNPDRVRQDWSTSASNGCVGRAPPIPHRPGRLWQNHHSERRPAPIPPRSDDTDSLTTTSTDTMTANYDNPQRIMSGLVQSTSSVSPDGSTSSSLLPRRGNTDVHDADCKELERSNRRMTMLFYVLATLCVLVILTYVLAIALIFIKLSRMGDPNQPFSGSRDAEEARRDTKLSQELPLAEKNCVPKRDIDNFKEIWDPEDQRDVKDLLDGSAHVFHPETPKGAMYCFKSLKWAPQIMGKISSRVQQSVSYIAGQQEKINETVFSLLTDNNTKSQCTEKEKGGSSGTATDAGYSVFAHYFLDRKGCSDKEGSLKWDREGRKSTRNRLDVNFTTGEFTIKHSGYYFIYSHLVFRQESLSSDRIHSIFRGHGGPREMMLMRSREGPASLLQGVFMLQEKDTLTVRAVSCKLDRSRDGVSYFGAYLIRT